MGRSILVPYVGAYFKSDLSKSEFDEILNINNFREDYYDENDELIECKMNEECNYEMFVWAYEGLENFCILIPNDEIEEIPFSVNTGDFNDEFEIEWELYEPEKYIENLKIAYAKQWHLLKKWFGDKIKIAFGSINYVEEIA